MISQSHFSFRSGRS